MEVEVVVVQGVEEMVREGRQAGRQARDVVKLTKRIGKGKDSNERIHCRV